MPDLSIGLLREILSKKKRPMGAFFKPELFLLKQGKDRRRQLIRLCQHRGTGPLNDLCSCQL
jgi:hypothetical protein